MSFGANKVTSADGAGRWFPYLALVRAAAEFRRSALSAL